MSHNSKRNIQDLRAESALMKIRAFCNRQAAKVFGDLLMQGHQSDAEVAATLIDEELKSAGARFAAHIKVEGIEMWRRFQVIEWVGATHIEDLPEYTSLEHAKLTTELLVQALKATPKEERSKMLDAGEHPFVPSAATIVDQYGYAMARMESHDGVFLWVTWRGIDGAHMPIDEIRSEVKAIRTRMIEIKRLGDVEAARGMAREAQRLSDIADMRQRMSCPVA